MPEIEFKKCGDQKLILLVKIVQKFISYSWYKV